MEVLLNKISGYASAITSMYTSKRHLTKEKVSDIYLMEKLNTKRDFFTQLFPISAFAE